LTICSESVKQGRETFPAFYQAQLRARIPFEFVLSWNFKGTVCIEQNYRDIMLRLLLISVWIHQVSSSSDLFPETSWQSPNPDDYPMPPLNQDGTSSQSLNQDRGSMANEDGYLTNVLKFGFDSEVITPELYSAVTNNNLAAVEQCLNDAHDDFELQQLFTDFVVCAAINCGHVELVERYWGLQSVAPDVLRKLARNSHDHEMIVWFMSQYPDLDLYDIVTFPSAAAYLYQLQDIVTDFLISRRLPFEEDDLASGSGSMRLLRNVLAHPLVDHILAMVFVSLEFEVDADGNTDPGPDHDEAARKEFWDSVRVRFITVMDMFGDDNHIEAILSNAHAGLPDHPPWNQYVDGHYLPETNFDLYCDLFSDPESERFRKFYQDQILMDEPRVSSYYSYRHDRSHSWASRDAIRERCEIASNEIARDDNHDDGMIDTSAIRSSSEALDECLDGIERLPLDQVCNT
jgi:hypothetical protein